MFMFNYTLYPFLSLKESRFFSSRLTFTQFEYSVLGTVVEVQKPRVVFHFTNYLFHDYFQPAFLGWSPNFNEEGSVIATILSSLQGFPKTLVVGGVV